MSTQRLGFLINPIAGMGGAVGLKGTDGGLARKARALGAQPRAPDRALQTVSALVAGGTRRPQIACAAGSMGADVAVAAGFEPLIVHTAAGRYTTAADTRQAARALLRHGIDLLLFAGGDGTARDLLAAIGVRVPVLGIPCGVKMHSAVFATTPRAAADVVCAFLDAPDPQRLLHDAEVMDRHAGEDSLAAHSPELFGIVRTPRVARLVSPAKSGATADALLGGACKTAARAAADGRVTLIGPGTTTQRIKHELGFSGTLLGVDAVSNGRLLGLDLNEYDILRLIEGRDARIVVSVVGGQGFLFGRGNQQLSASVIRRVGIDNLVVVASADKLAALSGSGLCVDTGDATFDDEFPAYLPVLTGAQRRALVAVRTNTGKP